jgi:hypothetical protein
MTSSAPTTGGLNLVVPLSMSGEGFVLNALPAQTPPYRLNRRPGAVKTETRRLVGPNPNAATSDKGWLYLTSKGASNGYNSE